MKAIDFACRLLLQLERDPMPSIQQRILVAIGAGLDNCQDIAIHCNISSQKTAAHLVILERHLLVMREREKRPDRYFLLDEGKEKLRFFFNFIPPAPPNYV